MFDRCCLSCCCCYATNAAADEFEELSQRMICESDTWQHKLSALQLSNV